MSARLCLLIDYSYEDMEVMYPKIRLTEDNILVSVVGAHVAGTKYTGKFGYPCKSDLCIDDVSADQFDGLAIPGGFAPDYMRRNQKMLDLILQMHQQGKPVAAICHAPWMLCSARWPDTNTPLIAGVQCTSFVAIRDDVINAGGEWVDKAVVVDRNIITSRTPDDLSAWCKALSAATISASIARPLDLPPPDALQQNSEPCQADSFPKQSKVRELYDVVTARCGKYTMAHFAAHSKEVRFGSHELEGAPSYGKGAELEAFRAAGGIDRVDDLTKTLWEADDYLSLDGAMLFGTFMSWFELRNEMEEVDEDVLLALIKDAGSIAYLPESHPMRRNVEYWSRS